MGAGWSGAFVAKLSLKKSLALSIHYIVYYLAKSEFLDQFFFYLFKPLEYSK